MWEYHFNKGKILLSRGILNENENKVEIMFPYPFPLKPNKGKLNLIKLNNKIVILCYYLFIYS